MPLPSLSPKQSDVLTALRNFLLSTLPTQVEVIRGQDNRVPEPISSDFVVMTPIMQKRLETNIDIYADTAFRGSIVGNVLTITQIFHGSVNIGNTVFGTGVSTGTYVTGTLSGSVGGTGTYSISTINGTISSQTMATGVLFAMQPTEWTIQLDIHGPNSADNAVIVSTLFRDDFGIQNFSPQITPPPGWGNIPIGGTLSVPYIAFAPLYADDPVQRPFINAENQYETRWVLDACIQANQIVVAPQMFAGSLAVTLQNVDAVIHGFFTFNLSKVSGFDFLGSGPGGFQLDQSPLDSPDVLTATGPHVGPEAPVVTPDEFELNKSTMGGPDVV